MAVTWVRETHARSGGDDTETEHRYTRTWRVVTDTPLDGPMVVLEAKDPTDGWQKVAQVNDRYEELNVLTGAVLRFDENSVCVERRCEPDADDMQAWTVTAEYVGLDDPTNLPAEAKYQPVPYQEALVDDLDGKPVLNSARQPFEQGIAVERGRFRLVLVQNVLTWNPVEMEAYQHTTNQNAFQPCGPNSPYIFDPGTCKLASLSASLVRRAGTRSFYWRRRAEIDFKADGWKVKVRDAGTHYLQGGVGPPLPFHAGGAGVTGLLKPNGDRVAKGDPVPAPLEFTGYRPKDWAPLGLRYADTP